MEKIITYGGAAAKAHLFIACFHLRHNSKVTYAHPTLKLIEKTVLFSSDIAGQIIIYMLCQNAPMKIDGENCHRVFTTLSILMNILFY